MDRRVSRKTTAGKVQAQQNTYLWLLFPHGFEFFISPAQLFVWVGFCT